MPAIDERMKQNWWAEGDTPVRTDSRVTYFVDGRTAMLEMCRHFIRAHKYIYLANWGITPLMELVRGTDHRAGPDGSSAQEALLADLRLEGFQEEDIEFWRAHNLSVQAVLGYAVSKGVEVNVLIWESLEFFSHSNPKTAREQLAEVGVTCILDDSARGLLHHPVESLHQKISIVDGMYAFVGGVDPLIEKNGDFDRWDTESHPFTSPLRQTPKGTSPHPWHDAHALIEGPAVGDVELNFRQRWNDVVQRHRWDQKLLVPEHPLAPPLETSTITQVARTIPEHTYSFKPLIIRGISQLYINALSNAQYFVYLENQYLWLHTYMGIDIPIVGADNPQMEHIVHELGEALRRGATIALLLPDHPNAGRGFTDEGLEALRKYAPEAKEQGRLQAFCLGTSTSSASIRFANDGSAQALRREKEDDEHYRPIYVHAKVAIVDDLWTTVGSANLNNRGMRDDTEMNVATLDTQLAYSLRLVLWAEHLGLISDHDLFAMLDYARHRRQARRDERTERILRYLEETLGDPVVGVRMMAERAQDNLRRYKAKLPLIGHLLPYLTEDEAEQQGLNFREEHGWIEEP